MRTSKKVKKHDMQKLSNDIIISDEMEPTESYAGVGRENIVTSKGDQQAVIEFKECSKQSPSKGSSTQTPYFSDVSLTKHHTSPELEFKLPIKDVLFSEHDESSKKKNNHLPSARRHKMNITSATVLPELNLKGDRELSVEKKKSINVQIEKFSNRKVKQTITDRKNKMKEIRERAKQNWSNFKSEIEFVKSVEMDDTVVMNSALAILKDEKQLNVLLNEININDKENVLSNSSTNDFVNDTPINGTNLRPAESKELLPKERCNDDSTEIYSLKMVIKPMVHEILHNPIHEELAIVLKQTLFDSTSRCWGSEWYRQNIEFCSIDSDLSYAVIQRMRGPNSLMAIIQAEFLVEALFTSNDQQNWSSNVRKNRNKLLARSLSRIISRCKKSKSDNIKVCLMDSNLKGRNIGLLKPDGITECIIIYELKTKEDVQDFIYYHISQFIETNNPGLILLVLSCLLTYGIVNFKDEMKSNIDRLISPLGVPRNELMFLLLSGSICTHTFNETIEVVDPITKEITLLSGVQSRSTVGFLAIDNHCPCCQEIGTYLKTPKYPVWIVKWNSHDFCVFFCHNLSLINDWKTEIRFRLHMFSPFFVNRKAISMIVDSSKTAIETQKEEQKLQEDKQKSKIRNLENLQSALKSMSENTLKFLLDENTLENYVDDTINCSFESNESISYLDEIIHVKWPNATVTLDDLSVDMKGLFKK